ncbi:MAG: hypothetical protein DRP66_08255 [Planctomycetota bacterium]|nr:MAG: hypothetical protein DRP66_08255 [Planctomycetota bacterium]
MKIIGQPADYSEILQRIFWFSIATGLFSTVMLAKASPAVQEFIDSITTKADLGPIKSIKVLYVLIPGAIAVVSRMIKLHDRISDLFRIRFCFDTRFFLFPLCQGSGVPLTAARKAMIRQTRNDSMYQTVYGYAGFKNPDIDDQLVRTSADNWGWFWVLVESSFLLLITVIIFACMQKWNYVTGFLCVILAEVALMLIQALACIRSAKPQVNAILSDPERKNTIRKYFNSL